MSAWVKVGAKCVCVDGEQGPMWHANFDGCRLPTKGHVYTIRAIDSLHGLLLSEIRNRRVRWVGGYVELHFRVDRFRPIITRTQEDDVALFRDLLETVGADA